MNFGDKVKQIIAAVAPTAGTLLGGPLGGLAGNFIAKKLGTDTATNVQQATEDAILGQKPEIIAQLREAEIDLQKHLADNGIDLERIAAADRANARDREVKAGDSWTPRIIATVVISGWFAIQWFLLQHVVPQEMREIIMRTLGTLDMALGLVLGYYFGSSASSHNKDETLASIAKK